LILPVVICLSQRLSHACLSPTKQTSETANGSLNQLRFPRCYSRYTDNCGNSRANTCTEVSTRKGRDAYIRPRPMPATATRR